MSTPDYSNVGDSHVPHEAEAAAATDAQMRRTSTHAAIADVASPGATYTQSEMVALRNAVNNILAVLRDAELIPSA